MQFIRYASASNLNLLSDSSARLFDLFLFRKSPGFDDYFETEKLKDTPTNFSRIRCPFVRLAAEKIESLVLRRLDFARRLRNCLEYFRHARALSGLQFSVEMDLIACAASALRRTKRGMKTKRINENFMQYAWYDFVGSIGVGL
jgi:hypothetical protein